MSFLDDLAKRALAAGSRIYDQANPLDNGRTIKQRTPTNTRSVVDQATHNGLTNTVGNLTYKPAAATLSNAIIEPARALLAQATGNRAAMQAAEQRKQQSFDNSFGGFFVNNIANAGKAGYDLGFKAPINDLAGNQAAAQQARTAGLNEFNKTVIGQATRPAQYGIAAAGGATPEQQQQVGLDPNATGAQKYFADPVMGTIGTAGLVGGIKGGTAKVGENIKPLDQSGHIGGNKPSSKQAQIPKQQLPKGPTMVQNRLTEGGKAGRQNLSPEAQAGISGKHTIRDTEALDLQAKAAADGMDIDTTVQNALQSLQAPAGKINDQAVAFAKEAIERADTAGRLEDAINIHDQLSAHLVEAGRTIQAASLLYKLSPQGLFYKAVRDIKKSGAELTPELQAKLQEQAEAVKNAADGAAKDRARAEFSKTVADNLKQKTANNILSVWKAGLLSGAKTQGGNFVSNGTFAGLDAASSIPAAGFDRALSAFTGKRAKAATPLAERGKGFGEGIKSGIDTLRTGIDMRNMDGAKYETHGELNFKNPVIQNVFGKTSNLVFRSMNAADQPFYYSALKNKLYELANVEGINKGLKGKQLDDFTENLYNNPSTAIAERAQAEAQKAVLGQDNKVASIISNAAQQYPAVGVLVPFVKVPTNFLVRSLDYTPAGAIKGIVKAVREGKNFDQRALSEALGEATTGTAVIYLGAELANAKRLSGQYPSNDPKEAARWKAEGIQPNSIKIKNPVTGKDEWVSLNYLGPVGLLLGAGQDFHDAAARGDNGTVASIAGVGKNLTGQSFLTGFSGFSDAIQDPERNAKSFVNQQAGSIVPTWLSDQANNLDSNQRETNNPLQAIQARTPIARNLLPEKEDVYGNKLKQRTDPLNLWLNPLKPSTSTTNKNDAVAEVSRLHNVDKNNKDLQITPTPIDKTITINGEKVKLNDQQKRQLQEQIGQATQSKWSDLIKTSEYQGLSDTDKATALDNLRKDATEVAQRDFVSNNNLGEFAKGPSTKAAALASNSVDLASYAKNNSDDTSSSGGSTVAVSKNLDGDSKQILSKYNSLDKAGRTKLFNDNNDAEYKYEKAKYENDKANGLLSKADDARAKNSLAKAQVGTKFTKEVRDLYGLTKAELTSVLSSDSNGKALADQIVAYGDAIEKAKLGDNKFRNKNGSVSFGTASGSGGSKSSGISSLISSTVSAANAASKAKVSGGKATFNNKISRRGIQQYSKGNSTKVAVTKKQLRSS